MRQLEGKFAAKVVSLNFERSVPEIKSTSVIASKVARRLAEDQGAYEALLIDRMGIAREGAWTNFFWMNNRGIWFTPKNLILDGVTKGLVNEFFEASRLPKIVSLDETIANIKDSIAAGFLTNAVHGMIPIEYLDGKRLEMTDFSLDLSKRFNEYRTVFLERV